ncbi:alpha-N-acetylgalactosaminidase-like [Ctenocephalides felis]|uniref:alpha-N-acetylgalactosaminidase-like n=1 Tax=Ctenocephalides felis TaxID=7515 RepID=UPI000E6E4AB7|nr:alpha-N-acetylgalactosaminidase-like [Ctenocephalides felis]
MDKFLISTKWLLLLLNVVLPCLCLDNGLALTPPMGWISWERFRCVTDCRDFPDQCLDENLIMQMADLLSSEGYSQVGYNYVIVDDCWSAIERVFCHKFEDKVLIPSKERFPHGIPFLAEHVHSLGLLFGLYADIGNYTCAGYPGSAGHYETDAFTFADWGIDFLKMDGCHWPPECLPPEYMKFGQALNETGHPIVYSCSWPSYQQDVNMSPNYELAAETCNMWRGYLDIQDSWQSVVDIIDYYASVQDDVAPRAGPGHWNDPDMLLVGGYGLSPDQAKAQMSVWAIMAAPLLLSADLRTMTEQNKEIAMNKGVIAVDQDKLGIQGRRLYEKRGLEVWTRPILPVWDRYKSLAIVFFNRR